MLLYLIGIVIFFLIVMLVSFPEWRLKVVASVAGLALLSTGFMFVILYLGALAFIRMPFIHVLVSVAVICYIIPFTLLFLHFWETYPRPERRLKIAKRTTILISIITVAFVGGGFVAISLAFSPIDRSDPFYPPIDQSPPEGPIVAYLSLPISVYTWRTEYGWEGSRPVNWSGWKAQGWLSIFPYNNDGFVGLELACTVDVFKDGTIKVQLRNRPKFDVYAYTGPAKTEIDYVSLHGVIAYGATPYDGERYELTLVSAIKNGKEDVTDIVLSSDDQRVPLEPRDHLTLSFQVPANITCHEIRWKTGIFPWNYVTAKQPEFGWYSFTVEGRHME